MSELRLPGEQNVVTADWPSRSRARSPRPGAHRGISDVKNDFVALRRMRSDGERVECGIGCVRACVHMCGIRHCFPQTADMMSNVEWREKVMKKKKSPISQLGDEFVGYFTGCFLLFCFSRSIFFFFLYFLYVT